jgi:hypothetical protein
MEKQILKIGKYKKNMRIQEMSIMEHNGHKWIVEMLIHKQMQKYHIFIQLQHNMNVKKSIVETQMQNKDTIEFVIKIDVKE